MDIRSSPTGQTLPILRYGIVLCYAALSAVTVVLASKEGVPLVVVAPVGSVIIFAAGWRAREADVIYLAWLDQGSNLILFEAVSVSLSVMVFSIVMVLLLADLAHITEAFGASRDANSLDLIRSQSIKLVLIGASSGLLAFGGSTLSPFFPTSSVHALDVAAVAVLALLAVTALTLLDR